MKQIILYQILIILFVQQACTVDFIGPKVIYNGGLHQISASQDNNVWGINTSNQIYIKTATAWNQVNGGLNSIFINGSFVYGIVNDNNIYKRGSDWSLLYTYSGARQLICDTAENLYLRTTSNTLFYREASGSTWDSCNGTFTYIDIISNIIVAVNSSGQIFYKNLENTSIIDGTWNEIDNENLVFTSATIGSDNKILACTDGRLVYAKKSPTQGTWIYVTDNITQLSSKGSNIWGVRRDTSVIYYLETDTQDCNFKCDSCVTTIATCLWCNYEPHRQLSNNCECDSGYGDNNSLECFLCEHPCSQCSGTTTTCTECKYTINRNTTPLCTCLDGFYDDQTDCIACDYKCSICSTTDQNTCDFCFDSTRINPPTCGCIDTKYDDGSSNSCQDCQYPCLNCTAQFQCTSCSTPQNRIDTTFCLCQNGYFENGNFCEACNYKCTVCGTSINDCTVCQSNRINPPSCDCPDTFFNDDVNSECQSCVYPCTNCTALNVCLTCSNISNRADIPNCDCNQGYFDNQSACIVCNYKYSTCTDNSTNCNVCSDVNRENSPTCTCIDGYFDDGSSSQCQNCVYPCQNCSDSQTCTSCATTQNRLNTSACQCENGYYDNNSLCDQCDFKCSTCGTSSTNCIICISNRINPPTCNCPDTYFSDGTNSTCVQCQYPCANCLSQNVCTSCQSINNRENAPNCDCSIGYYENGAQCVSCQQKCLTCSNSQDNCQICSHSTRQNAPTCDCIDGYFDDNISIECQQCQFPCQNCTDLTTCITCDSSIISVAQAPPSCNCQDGKFLQSQMCQDCDQKCLTCLTQSTNCLICQGNNRNIQDQCNCLTGFYENQSNECVSCIYPCQTCISDTYCLTCIDSINRQDTPICTCKLGFQDINQMCNDICGDGITPQNSQFPCDDGNNINNDGCSGTCEVEKGYLCEGGSEISKDICYKAQSNIFNWKLLGLNDLIIDEQNIETQKIIQFQIQFSLEIDPETLPNKDLNPYQKFELTNDSDTDSIDISITIDNSNKTDLFNVQLQIKKTIKDQYLVIQFQNIKDMMFQLLQSQTTNNNSPLLSPCVSTNNRYQNQLEEINADSIQEQLQLDINNSENNSIKSKPLSTNTVNIKSKTFENVSQNSFKQNQDDDFDINNMHFDLNPVTRRLAGVFNKLEFSQINESNNYQSELVNKIVFGSLACPDFSQAKNVIKQRKNIKKQKQLNKQNTEQIEIDQQSQFFQNNVVRRLAGDFNPQEFLQDDQISQSTNNNKNKTNSKDEETNNTNAIDFPLIECQQQQNSQNNFNKLRQNSQKSLQNNNKQDNFTDQKSQTQTLQSYNLQKQNSASKPIEKLQKKYKIQNIFKNLNFKDKPREIKQYQLQKDPQQEELNKQKNNLMKNAYK